MLLLLLLYNTTFSLDFISLFNFFSSSSSSSISLTKQRTFYCNTVAAFLFFIRKMEINFENFKCICIIRVMWYDMHSSILEFCLQQCFKLITICLPSELLFFTSTSLICYSILSYVCEDKFEFKNPKRNPQILAAPHLTLTEQNFVLTA